MQGFNCSVTFSIAAVTCGPCFGQVNCRWIAFLFLSELYRASPLTHTGQTPHTGCQLLDFHLWGIVLFPLTDTSSRKQRITLRCQPQSSVLTLINVCLSVCYPTMLAAALSLLHMCPPQHSSLAIHSIVCAALLYSPALMQYIFTVKCWNAWSVFYF